MGVRNFAKSYSAFVWNSAVRASITGFLAGGIGLVCVTQTAGQQECRPALAFREVRFSEMLPPTLARRWTAVISVDASRCAANSQGQFEIVVSRLKENGPDLEFRERFSWLPSGVQVGIEFAPDEAVGRYWIDNVTPCSCAG
ncbi:MAG: hypothetical protein E6G96_01975 [Alphaproteobacteria bacterium]|nr:MAG: hypothetical protein E6G96_01975 [Alphaproteobacteria bacterium]